MKKVMSVIRMFTGVFLGIFVGIVLGVFGGLIVSYVTNGLIGSAQAATIPNTVDTIKIRNLPTGKALSVFYVSGREGAIASSGQSLLVRSVKSGPVRVDISSSGEATVPAVIIPPYGFDVTNYIVFVVHSPEQKLVYLNNLDGSIPTMRGVSSDELARRFTSDAFVHEGLGFLSFISMNDIKNRLGSITVDYVADLQH